MKNTARLTGSLAAILGGIAVIAAPIAGADATQDQAFLQTLSQKGITWPNGDDATMIKVWHAVCQDWAGGNTFDQTLADVKSALGLSDGPTAQVMGAATGVYCPQYESKFN